jgi:hypothetical protein
MKLLRLISICAGSIALLVAQTTTPVPPADQAAGAATKAEKKARAKAKKAAEQAGAPDKAVTPPTEVAPPTKVTPRTEMKPQTGAAGGSAHRMMPTVSESEINAAKASGKVWVNTDTGVYHKGGKWYGTTKQGQFMTEDEAIRSGYRAAKH